MTTFMQNSRQTVVDNSYFDVQAGIASSYFGSMTNTQHQNRDDWTFRIMERRETERAAAPSLGRFANLPEDGLDDLTQDMEKLSLFGRTKDQVVLDPSLQNGSSVRFTTFVKMEDGEVPVVTLDEIKGSKVIPIPSYDYKGSSSPGGTDPTTAFGSFPLSYGVGAMDELDLVPTSLDVLPEGSEENMKFDEQQRFFTPFASSSHSTTDPFPVFDNHVFISDIGSPPRASSELQDNDKPPRDVPTLYLTLEGISVNSDPTLFPLLHTDTRNEQVAAPGGTNNPLLPQTFFSSLNDALGSSPMPYPFEQTPARSSLPFPLESPAHSFQPSTQSSDELKALFEKALEDPFTSPEFQSYSRYDSYSLSDWINPPSLSPSYTDSSCSQDSTIYSPTSSRSPTSLSFVSPQSLIAAMPFQPLPTQDDLASPTHVDPALLSLDKVHFEESFPAFVAPEDNTRSRPIQKAAQVHEIIMVQVAPYPIGPPVPKRKTSPSSNNKSKGKAKAIPDGDDGDSDGAHGKERKKKRKRDEADKVRCEIEGCNRSFFSNWELKRHQKNLHEIGEETRKAAVCPKCGRPFASGRKDSVDRHLELNACGKRNPRKSPKRFTTGQTS